MYIPVVPQVEPCPPSNITLPPHCPLSDIPGFLLYESLNRNHVFGHPSTQPRIRESRDLLDKIKKHGGKAVSKYGQKAISKYTNKSKGSHSKGSGAMATGMGAIAGGLLVLGLMYLVWRKRDYLWRRARLEEEASSMFEGNDDDDIDRSKIPFGQPWSHRLIAERRAAAEAA
ncbi:hypothetical protein SNK03_011756 [Fusarium graminearum]|uniref:Chromosome 3, complete genome n=1 Tax=Gibberella zeae (strain ATCC MYA-4620 / CBS 123657 / FGSC 9075 / NRRL 31084 / PH-1) TaxID=229533 RepID=I1RP11_GIBZE|nr:hypothetical protein FGSG_05760 [Fusarium graminearum PH-1]ESU11771.1 hypothetical protein FGSG_05760 [Fusarium graminearum PH-1]CEF86317.1 unnamed protein product [Fusarium graminearum]CZS84450.1 unnamed protein product [Fusarium graminearum]|eukprot:XP_011324347.1 hypothetical protein FGSG_05760 [Fusarium graminearum PH-1]